MPPKPAEPHHGVRVPPIRSEEEALAVVSEVARLIVARARASQVTLGPEEFENYQAEGEGIDTNWDYRQRQSKPSILNILSNLELLTGLLEKKSFQANEIVIRWITFMTANLNILNTKDIKEWNTVFGL